MLLPPALSTQERRSYDLDDLRVFYILCEELGIVNEEKIQKAFSLLMEWAGEYKFIEEFMILKEYVEKRKIDNQF